MHVYDSIYRAKKYHTDFFSKTKDLIISQYESAFTFFEKKCGPKMKDFVKPIHTICFAQKDVLNTTDEGFSFDQCFVC